MQKQNQIKNQAKSKNQAQLQMPIQDKVQNRVFSKLLRAGGKNYFFDVKLTSNGNNCLSITDLYKNKKGEKVTNRMMIFGDHVSSFISTFEEAKTYLS
ncbi:MAG: DUF3276 family protein [bacterium]